MTSPARQALGFGLVGAAGFATDALLFLVFSQGAGWPVMASRALAFLPATGVTWWLNRHYVFRTAGGARSRRGEYLRHLAIQGIGIAINFATFYAAVRAGLGAGSAQLLPLALGSGVAMVFNFLGARRLVFLR
jgi:putative flippase GtrA